MTMRSHALCAPSLVTGSTNLHYELAVNTMHAVVLKDTTIIVDDYIRLRPEYGDLLDANGHNSLHKVDRCIDVRSTAVRNATQEHPVARSCGADQFTAGSGNPTERRALVQSDH